MATAKHRHLFLSGSFSENKFIFPACSLSAGPSCHSHAGVELGGSGSGPLPIPRVGSALPDLRSSRGAGV